MTETQLEDGWIKHVPGDPPPCRNDQPIEIRDANNYGYVFHRDDRCDPLFWSADYCVPIIAWRPVGWEYKPEPKPLELTLTETQINAFINLLSAAETAYREENAYWQDQEETNDHHRPDWLHQLDQSLLGIETNFPNLHLDDEAGAWTKADY
jgi:hypothetical protein